MSEPTSSTTPSTPWTPFVLAIAWLVPKSVIVGLWLAFAHGVQGDVFYYHRSLEAMATKGPAATLIEYPTPVIWFLQSLQPFTTGAPVRYLAHFLVAMLLLDGILTVALWRRWHAAGRSRHPWPVLFWIGFIFLISPTAYLRFDLVTAVLAAGALLLLASRRPGVAGVLAGVGAAVKLWPALLWFALLGRRENRGRASAGFWGTGVALAAASLVWAGWDRLLSPLTWQQGRGLQVESVWATVPMIANAIDARFSTGISKYQAFEVYGPGVGAWVKVADLATAVGMLAFLALLVWWLRSPRRDDIVLAGLVMVLAAVVMIVTNKTFSPQYLLWVGGPFAAVLALDDATGGPCRDLRRLSLALLVVMALTGIVYPIGYHNLVHGTGLLRGLVTVALVLRNLAFVGFTGLLVSTVIARIRSLEVPR